MFAQIFSILPHNITFLTNSAKRHRYFLLYIYERPLYKSLHYLILTYKQYKYFPIPHDYTELGYFARIKHILDIFSLA